MRLKQIKMRNFGQFSQQTFTLPEGNLDVFFGPNEAGKSTTVAFIKQVMFGFNLKNTASSFFEDYEPLSKSYPMGGSLVFDADDGEYELTRTWSKGEKPKTGKLTVCKDGQEVPESLFFDQIQNIDGGFYADSFIFNEDLLRQVTGLSEGEILENIYYLGAAQSSQLLAIRQDLEKEASSLFKPTSHKMPVNVALDKVQADRAQAAAAGEEFDAYKRLNDELLQEEGKAAKIAKQISELEGELKKREKMAEQVQNYQSYLELKQQVKAVDFDEEGYQQAVKLNAQVQTLQATIGKEKASLKPLAQDLDLPERRKQLSAFKKAAAELERKLTAVNDQLDALASKQASLLKLTANLNKVVSLTPDEFNRLHADWTNSRQKEAAADDQLKQLASQTDKADETAGAAKKPNLLVYGALYLLISLLIAFIAKSPVLLAVLVAVGLGLYFWQAGRQKQAQASGRAEQAAKAEQAQRLRQELLDEEEAFARRYGFRASDVNLDDLVSSYRDFVINATQVKELQDKRESLADSLEALAKQIQDWTKTPVPQDLAAISGQLEAADEQLTLYERQQRDFDQASAQVANDQKLLREVDLRLQKLLTKEKVKSLDEFTERAKEQRRQASLQAQLTAVKNALGEQLARFEAGGFDASQLAAATAELSQQLAEAKRRLQLEQQAISDLHARRGQYADSAKVFALKQNLAKDEAQFKKDSQDYLASLLAGQVIGRALDLASNDRFPKMLKTAKDYFSLLTGGRYLDIILPEKKSKRTPLKVVRADKKKLPVEYLSRGTQEQLYFALKLAFVVQIEDKIDLPVLIDDSFVNFDGKRTGYIAGLLAKLSQDKQILVFTAREDLARQLSDAPLRYVKED